MYVCKIQYSKYVPNSVSTKIFTLDTAWFSQITPYNLHTVYKCSYLNNIYSKYLDFRQ